MARGRLRGNASQFVRGYRDHERGIRPAAEFTVTHRGVHPNDSVAVVSHRLMPSEENHCDAGPYR